MNYTNREVVRRLKQYDMFLNSLSLTVDKVQRERICDQLDKIEKQILLETNTEYEEQYLLLLGEETHFFPEEKTKLRKLISLIEERKKYLEDRKNKHREITGSLVELTTFLGEDKKTKFKNRLDIIEKYEDNKVKKETIIKEMKTLDVKLSEASRIVKANTRLNEILENKKKELITKEIEKQKLYTLVDKRQDILNKFYNYEDALNLAKDNLKTAKSLGESLVISECNKMLLEVTEEYSKYNEQVNIINLIDIYDKKVNNYDELQEKREQINEILKNISNSSLYNSIGEEINKEYNTIKVEKEDIEKYERLKQERERKNRLLYEIEEENNSKEFKSVVDEFVKNERRVHEEQIMKAKQEEFQERQKKLLEEQKIEASRVRRQKLIEEARLKEQQERVKKVKELQQKTVINPKKEEKTITSNETLNNEKMINPLKNRTFEEIVSLNNEFDTDELFENTKIVPNKRLNESKSLFDSVEDSKIENELEKVIWEVPAPTLETSSLSENKPVWKEPAIDTSTDLFKEDEVKEEPKEKILAEKPSIYDILENNQNIIWKTTDTNINKETIPVIGNNNLKPEILDNRKVNDMTFPKINSKEGDILWKETL